MPGRARLAHERAIADYKVGADQSQDLGQLRMTGCEIDDRHQHQQASRHGIEHELNCGIDAARSAPDADQKIHGDQHHFPEHVEKKKIQRNESTEHAGF